MDYVKFIYRPLAARAARQALIGRNRAQRSPDRGRFTRADVDTLLKTAWRDYAERIVTLQPEPGIPFDEAPTFFRNLGGSWKKHGARTSCTSGSYTDRKDAA